MDSAKGSCAEKCDGIKRFGLEVIAKLGFDAPGVTLLAGESCGFACGVG